MKDSVALLAFCLLAAGPAGAGVSLKGTGSYLSAPLYQELAAEYQILNTGTKVKFEVKSPSDALNQFLGRGAEFCAVDFPPTDMEERKSFGRTVLNLPIAIEAVAITYNLPGVPSGIKLTPELVSKIFRGDVKRWNDIAITELNPGVSFPPMDILVLHQEEESSLRDLFPGSLAWLDPAWTDKHEKDKNLKWPVGRGLKGNDKVMEKLKQSPGYIAAVDYSYSARHQMPMAQLRNEAFRFVGPSAPSLLAATQDWVSLPEDFRIVLSRSRNPGAYPFCSFSWMLVYEDEFRATHDHRKSRALVDFIQWTFNEGQKWVADSDFVPLPESFLAQVREKIKEIKY